MRLIFYRLQPLVPIHYQSFVLYFYVNKCCCRFPFFFFSYISRSLFVVLLGSILIIIDGHTFYYLTSLVVIVSFFVLFFLREKERKRFIMHLIARGIWESSSINWIETKNISIMKLTIIIIRIK